MASAASGFPASQPGNSDRRSISAYFDATVPHYRIFWHGRTGALHYGFRDRGTQGAASELLNTNRVLAELAGVRAGARVFDAGCGVAGSAVWLARHRGARVAGVSLSQRQLVDAGRRVRDADLAGQITLQRADYTCAPFADQTFDVFWALESSCYTADKLALAREAFRLLRPGGRLVIADGFLRRQPSNERERREYAWFRRGLVLPEMFQVDDLERALREVGFVAVGSWDKTREADPSGRRLYRRCRAAYPIALVGRALGLTSQLLADNVRAGIAQYRMIRDDLIGYAVVRALRPAQDSP